MIEVTASVPAVVVDGADQRGQAAQALMAAGWHIRHGFMLPVEPWDLRRARFACVGEVHGRDLAEAALLAAVRGCALVLSVGEGVPATFADDLRRVAMVATGSSSVATSGLAPSVEGPVLSREEEELLRLLGEGNSVSVAARRTNLAPRTAHRRLAHARDTLGVATNREAIVRMAADRGGTSS